MNISYFYLTNKNVVFKDLKQKSSLIIKRTDDFVLEIPLEDPVYISSVLISSVFNRSDFIFTWNIKNLFSWFKYHSCLSFVLKEISLFYDLGILYKYFKHNHEQPISINDCKINFMKLVKDKNVLKVYENVLFPLIVKTIPKLECNKIINIKENKTVHCVYDIEGQVNGRLSCSKEYGINVHSLTQEDKKNIDCNASESLIYADISNCEVVVLSYLSKDEKLKEIIEQNDVYVEIAKELTGFNFHDLDKAKKLGKELFLPICYGLSFKNLAVKIKDEKIAAIIYNNFKTKFEQLYNWINETIYNANERIQDALGRVRVLENNEKYLAVNSQVQSLASTLCLEKLNLLSNARFFNVFFNVHDGYVLVCDKFYYEKSLEELDVIMRSPSFLIPEISFNYKFNNFKESYDS